MSKNTSLINPTIFSFFDLNVRSIWLWHKPYRVYMRKGLIRINNESVQAITIANIVNSMRQMNCNTKLKPYSSGKFKKFLNLVETESAQRGYRIILIESILNEFLPGVLERYGYVKLSNTNPVCMYKRIKIEE